MPWILSWLHFQAPNTGCTYAKCVCMLPSPPHPPPPVSRKVIAPCFGCSYVSASERGLPSFLPLPFLKPIHPRAFPLPPFCQYGSRVHIQQSPPSLPRRAGSGNTRNLTRDRHNNTLSSIFLHRKSQQGNVRFEEVSAYVYFRDTPVRIPYQEGTYIY